MAASLTEREGDLRSADRTRIHWRAWSPDKPKLTLAVVHGYFEHSGRYRVLAEAMGARGIATYALDLRGHGQSDGLRGHIDSWSQWEEDAEAFVALVLGEAGTEVVPLGHSFGGAILLSAVIGGRVRPKRFVVSSPALRPKLAVPAARAFAAKVMSRIAPRLALDAGLDPAGVSRIPEVVEAYKNDPMVFTKMTARTYTEWVANREAVLRDAAKINAPFLATHGTADPIIDVSGTVELHERATVPGRSLKLYEGARHESYNDLCAQEAFADLAAWLGRPSLQPGLQPSAPAE